MKWNNINRFCDEIQLIVCNIYKKNVAKTLNTTRASDLVKKLPDCLMACYLLDPISPSDAFRRINCSSVLEVLNTASFMRKIPLWYVSKTSIDGNLSFKNCKSQWNFIAFKVIKIPSLTIMRSVKFKVTIFRYHRTETLPARTSCLRRSLLWKTSFL